jgi:hypothetical protein
MLRVCSARALRTAWRTHQTAYEAQVGRDEALGGGGVTLLCEAGEGPFLRDAADQRQALDVGQILVERAATAAAAGGLTASR